MQSQCNSGPPPHLSCSRLAISWTRAGPPAGRFRARSDSAPHAGGDGLEVAQEARRAEAVVPVHDANAPAAAAAAAAHGRVGAAPLRQARHVGRAGLPVGGIGRRHHEQPLGHRHLRHGRTRP